jgi:hypothetical protein
MGPKKKKKEGGKKGAVDEEAAALSYNIYQELLKAGNKIEDVPQE